MFSKNRKVLDIQRSHLNDLEGDRVSLARRRKLPFLLVLTTNISYFWSLTSLKSISFYDFF